MVVSVIGSHCRSTLKRLKQGAYQVDALAKRVAIHRSFWRGDTKALRQNTAIVSNTRPVPEKATVAAFNFCVRRLLETRLFAVALDAEDILDLNIRSENWGLAEDDRAVP